MIVFFKNEHLRQENVEHPNHVGTFGVKKQIGNQENLINKK